MDHLALKIEIETGPLAAECLGKSDNDVAAIFNDLRFTTVKTFFINARYLMAALGPIPATTILDKLEAVALQSPPVSWALKFLQQESGVDVGHESTRGQVDALVVAEVLTAEEGQAIKNLALQPISRAELLGFGTVSYNDVHAARAL